MDHKIIVENWRQWLSSIVKTKGGTTDDFAAKVSARAEKIVDDIFVNIYRNDNDVTVYYATLDTENENFSINIASGARWLNPGLASSHTPFTGTKEKNDVTGTDLPWGFVRLSLRKNNGPCDGGWIIKATEAKKGWGPLLYDVAM